jgi:hypothetical protein
MSRTEPSASNGRNDVAKPRPRCLKIQSGLEVSGWPLHVSVRTPSAPIGTQPFDFKPRDALANGRSGTATTACDPGFAAGDSVKANMLSGHFRIQFELKLCLR